MDDLRLIPREFSLHWGFGDPLEVIDDRELLGRMAQLKQLASRPPQAPEQQTQGTAMGSTNARGTPIVADASTSRLRSDRPRTAPPGGRVSVPRADAASSMALPAAHEAARSNALEFRAKQRRDAAKELARLIEDFDVVAI